MIVSVVDALTGQRICGADVNAVIGSRGYPSDGCECLDGAPLTNAQCRYDIIVHQSGTYAISASAPGYRAAQQPGVNVQLDECGNVDMDINVTIMLTPSP